MGIIADEHKIIVAVDEFACQMKSRLLRKLQEGYAGWDDPSKVSNADLFAAMQADLIVDPTGKAVDIANRAMMLWFRK